MSSNRKIANKFFIKKIQENKTNFKKQIELKQQYVDSIKTNQS